MKVYTFFASSMTSVISGGNPELPHETLKTDLVPKTQSSDIHSQEIQFPVRKSQVILLKLLKHHSFLIQSLTHAKTHSWGGSSADVAKGWQLGSELTYLLLHSVLLQTDSYICLFLTDLSIDCCPRVNRKESYPKARPTSLIGEVYRSQSHKETMLLESATNTILSKCPQLPGAVPWWQDITLQVSLLWKQFLKETWKTIMSNLHIYKHKRDLYKLFLFLAFAVQHTGLSSAISY